MQPEHRAELVSRLVTAGVKEIEVASFVSPRAVPAMAGAAEVVAATRDAISDVDVTLWALVPNVKGSQMATDAGIDHLTVTVSASAAYSEKNTHMAIGQAFDELAAIRDAASRAVVDVVISCCFGSPFEGETITPDDVAALVNRARAAGADQVTLADTTGMATPRRINDVLSAVGIEIGLHLHDTRGTALLNAWTAIDQGVDRFDTALGGIGGSPFAPTAGGNLATEDLVMVLADAGMDTGIDLDRLLDIAPRLTELIGHTLPGRLSAAGALP